MFLIVFLNNIAHPSLLLGISEMLMLA